MNDRRVLDGVCQKFTSAIVLPYVRRSPRVESGSICPACRGDFLEALPAMLRPDAAGLSSSAILRLTKTWTTEYEAFRRRDLADREYVHLWADGVHFTIRLEEERLCAFVLIGVRPDGTKEVVGLEDGYRESAESWRTELRDLKRRGLRAPVLAIGDGALGFSAAVREVWPETAEQRCSVHRRQRVGQAAQESPDRARTKRCTRSCTPKRARSPSVRSGASRGSTVPSIPSPWRR